MPWLIKDAEKQENNLFFIHVPRCGGTSLMKNHHVPTKTLENRSFLGRIAMRIFFARYELLETCNFPIVSKGNFLCLVGMLFGIAALAVDGDYDNMSFYDCLAIIDIVFFGSLLLGLTFVFVAPTIARIQYIRRAFLLAQMGHGLMESVEWCTGTNIHGYMNHLTAHKVLDYGYISAQTWKEVSTMAIVRNPYSRMVSIYMYNRWGSSERFTDFVQRWYDMLIEYRENLQLDEWYTTCHGFAQCEFTHFKGQQLVQAIVKQEELKLLKDEKSASEAIEQGSSVKNLPPVVRKALLNMPHSNQRKRKDNWWMYYDQESMDLTYELNRLDFTIFRYDPDEILKKRPENNFESPTRFDVEPPQLRLVTSQKMRRDNKTGSSRFLQDIDHAAGLGDKNGSSSNKRRSSLISSIRLSLLLEEDDERKKDE